MCGIAGVIAGDARVDAMQLAERLTAALAHRGPDGCGYRPLADGRAAFGHRRLSIVDLALGDQPMPNEDGTVWLVFNGEIYNHLTLRRDLEARGHRFRTASDTEVIVHGWEEWGPDVLGRLNGIYAFALFDGRADRASSIWLARDPVGAKPLYVGRHRGAAWFASELGAARESGLADPELRGDAIDEFLVYRFVPSPGTFFRGTWKLPPSHYCRIALDRPLDEPVFERFTPQFAPATQPRNAGEWEEALRSTLSASVRRQLMSDVPVGSLLSGGVDSTVVTRMMSEALPAAPQTFAIGFTGAGAVDELSVARRAAAALGVPLAEVAVTEAEYLAQWPRQIAGMGEPIANSGQLLLELLCRRVGQTHKVVLTGQGADEPLGGYPRHAGERFRGIARALSPILDRIPERWASSDRIARLRRLAAEPDEARRFAEILAVFSPAEAAALGGRGADPDALAAPVRRWLPTESGPDGLNRLLHVDARLSLADDLLIVADAMSMRASVELRVPFLDLEFLALVEGMPSRYKVSRAGERKWLYRRAVSPLLPDALRSDLLGPRARLGRKLGFTTPIDRWFGEWLHRDAEASLLGPGSRIGDLVSGERLREVIVSARDRGHPRGRQMMSLYVLETWLQAVAGGSSGPDRGAVPALAAF